MENKWKKIKEMNDESKIRRVVYIGLWLDGCVSFSNLTMNRGQKINEVATYIGFGLYLECNVWMGHRRHAPNRLGCNV